MKTRVELVDLVPAGGRVAELGVAAGAFSEAMLRHCPCITLCSIDRWMDHHDEAEYQLAKMRLAKYGNRSQILRMTFVAALPLFRQAWFDLVYIDGYAHTGQEGGQTLRDWWPKVRPGGVLAGHDYTPKYQPTIDAVDAFVADLGLTLNVIEEQPYPSWWVRKPNPVSLEKTQDNSGKGT